MHLGISSRSNCWTATLCVLWSVFSLGDAFYQVGYPTVWREQTDDVKRTILLIDPSQHVEMDGILIAWNVFTDRGRRSMTAHLQIWRPINSANRHYQLVGDTFYKALWVGHTSFFLKPDDRITVKIGYILGISVPRYNPIPWSPTVCTKANTHLFKTFKHYPNELEIGTEFRFDSAVNDRYPCRKYSVNATIINRAEMQSFERYSAQLEENPARRPYGKDLATRRTPVRACAIIPAANLHSLVGANAIIHLAFFILHEPWHLIV